MNCRERTGIGYGPDDPYVDCPEYRTGHLHLRRVREEDACDLFDGFYGNR